MNITGAAPLGGAALPRPAPRLGYAPPGPGGLIKQRCDPYGAESRIKLLGGLYDERHLGRHMWHCPRESAGTYRMVCLHGHRGQPMPLCGPGYALADDGQWIPHPGHVAEISRRQAGACPACLWPPEARVLHEAGQGYEHELRAAMMTGNRAAEARLKQAMLDAGTKLQELNDRGIVHRCPLHLEEVS